MIDPVNAAKLRTDQIPDSSDPNKDTEIIAIIRRFASEDNIQLSHESIAEHKHTNEYSPLTGHLAILIETYNYLIAHGNYIPLGAATAAGIGSFIRNVLGSMTDWQKLRLGRTIEIDVKGRKIPIKDGDSFIDVIHAIEKELVNRPRTP